MVALEVGKRKGKSLRNVKAFNFSTRSSWLIAWLGFPDGSVDKRIHCNAGDPGSIPGTGRSTGEGVGYPLQYSGLEDSMDCVVHGVANSQTWLSDFYFTSSWLIIGLGMFQNLPFKLIILISELESFVNYRVAILSVFSWCFEYMMQTHKPFDTCKKSFSKFASLALCPV